MTARTRAQARVIDAVLDDGLIGGVPVRELIPDLPPGAPVQFDQASMQGDSPASSKATLVDPDRSHGPVLKFLRPSEESSGLLRVQLLMTFEDTEPLPLGEMQIRFDTTTGELLDGTGLAY